MENKRSLSLSISKAYSALQAARKCTRQLEQFADPEARGSLILLRRDIERAMKPLPRLQSKIHKGSLKPFAHADINERDPIRQA